MNLSVKKIQEIIKEAEAYADKNSIDDLYIKLSMSEVKAKKTGPQPKRKQTIFYQSKRPSPGSMLDKGKNEFEQYRARLQKILCTPSTKKPKKQFTAGEWQELVIALLADLIGTGGAALVLAIIYKRGLKWFCSLN